MADTEHSPSLREALEAAWTDDVGGGEASTDTGAAAAATEPVADAAGDAAARARDAAGRFASTGGAEGASDDSGGAVAAADGPPEGYSPDLWAQLTPEARAATSAWAGKQRETVAERDARLAGYEPIERVVGKRRDALKAQYGSEAAAFEQLFNLSDYASRDPAGFVQWFAQQRGINLAGMVPSQAQTQPAPQQGQPSDIRALVAQAVQEQTMAAEVDRGFAAFEANASLEHRNDAGVRRTMAALIQANIATDYTAAYAMAVQADPTIGPKLRENAAKATGAALTQTAVQAASSKASAAVSTTGAPGTARAPGSNAAPPTVRAALEAAWSSQATGRV